MRLASTLAALTLVLSTQAQATEWFEFSTREYGFAVNFPAEPAMKEISYTTASGAMVKAAVFAAQEGDGRYAVTVVDLSAAPLDEAGAIAHAAQTLRAKGKALYDADFNLDGIPGHQLSVVETGGRRMMAAIHLYEHRLFITEGSVGPGVMTPQQFQQSVAMIHPDGTIVNLEREGRVPRRQ